MKKLILIFLLTSSVGLSQTTDEDYDALLKKSPFITVFIVINESFMPYDKFL